MGVVPTTIALFIKQKEQIVKKIIVAIFATLLITACGSRTVVIEREATTTQPEVTNPAPETTTAPVETQPAMSADDKFIAGIMADYSWVVNKLGKVDLVKLGYLICGAIDEGTSFEDFVTMMYNSGIDGGVMGSLLREAVWNFCPNNQWFLDSAIDELSRG